MKTVLVADKFEPICELIEILLCREGYHVLTAKDSSGALRLARNCHIDLIICNSRMPDLHGDNLTSHFKALCPSTPIILLSGSDPLPEMNGTHDILIKPFTVAELRATVWHAMRGAMAPANSQAHAGV